MADDDTPPPLPPSLPPPPEDSEEPDKTPSQETPSMSKFQSLRSMMSASETMYSPMSASTPPFAVSSSSLYQSGAVPRPKIRSSADSAELDEELPAGESPRLRHGTLERPKRKVRLPSRTSLQSDPAAQGMQQDDAPEDFPPDLPPDLPPDESSDLPPDLHEFEVDSELMAPPPRPPPSLPPPDESSESTLLSSTPPSFRSTILLQSDSPTATPPHTLSNDPLSLPAEDRANQLNTHTETDSWDAKPPAMSIPTLDRGWTARVKTGIQRPMSAEYSSRHQPRLRDATKPSSVTSSPQRPLSSYPSRDNATSFQSSSASSLSSFTERIKKMKEKRVQQRSPQASPTLQQKQYSLGEPPHLQHPLARGSTSLEQKQARPASPTPSTDLLGSQPSLESLISTSTADADSLHSADGGTVRQSSLSWKSRFVQDSGHNVPSDWPLTVPSSDAFAPLSNETPPSPPHRDDGGESPTLNEDAAEADLPDLPPDLPPPPPPEEGPPEGNLQLGELYSPPSDLVAMYVYS